MDNRLCGELDYKYRCKIAGWCLSQFYGMKTAQVEVQLNRNYLPEFKELVIYVPDFDYPVVEKLQC